jgi:hypothetical protein
MAVHLRYLAVAVWLASLLSPTLRSKDGSYLLGYELAVNGLMGLLILLPFSLIGGLFYWLSLATNLLVLNELIRCFRRIECPWSLADTFKFQAAFLVNVGVASALNRSADFSHTRGLLNFPGVYFWLGAFGLLAAATTVIHRTFFAGLAIRLASIGMVALLVVIASFAALYTFFR